MRVRHFVCSFGTTGAVLIAFATTAGTAVAAKRVVELESMAEGEAAQHLCPLVRKTLEAFAASPEAQKPICDWRPLRFAEAGGLTLPDWQPAGDYVHSAGFARRFLETWLQSPAQRTGKTTDTLWHEKGYAQVFDGPAAALAWQEATFAVHGDLRGRRWLRLDATGCGRYPDTSIYYGNLPKLAVISRDETPLVRNQQGLQFEFSSDDVLLHEREAYDLSKFALPADGGARFDVRRINTDRAEGFEEWTLRTSAPLCVLKIHIRE